MASTPDTQVSLHQNQQSQQPKIQIYSPSNDEVSAFWREKYEKDAKKYWDIFYKRHQDKFFKDRHYLHKEWGHHFSGQGRRVILEVGCGAGNTIFPLLETYPDVFIHACDFSPRAVDLVKMHKDFSEDRVNAFACDLTADDLCQHVAPSSVDIVTMIFVLSAVSPGKMPKVIQNLRKVLKPDGRILFRDYATGDLAQERFTGKEQKISENFYVRGDGTRAFYFSDEFLENLFKENGFNMKEHFLCCKQVENRSREIIMNRRWVQAVFLLAGNDSLSIIATENEIIHSQGDDHGKKDILPESEIDMSEGMAREMFGVSSPREEIVEVSIQDYHFKIKLLSKEYQHTCSATGLMLWESARLMSSILAANQGIVSGKRVLELGCGCGGICSMIATTSAELVVATDGDTKALELLSENVVSNFRSPQSLDALSIRRLQWGSKSEIEAIKQLNGTGFDIIIGTDVTYVPLAIKPLFATARELISTGSDAKSALILCHVFRRVDEAFILSAASEYGFSLVDKWPADQTRNSSSPAGIIKNWFSEWQHDASYSALNIMYFCIA
ncbi:uncharacterized protein LOC127265642 [Andrographis paniculata]|uniref:uncharacterized protein LOC127265642 n=1 Tax=Andrographis paniculata TaxID=175694 RepID=UPI0021E8345A|nr:uncharacterized protein LOC127265642 [Andrographis paniculata]